MSFVQYYWNLFCYAFGGAWAIWELATSVIALVAGIIAWKHPHWESAMKNLLWMIPLGVFALMLLIRLAMAPYVMNANQEQKLNELQNKLIVQGERKNTKQEIRDFLESINPVILQQIDARQTEIRVLVGSTRESVLFELSRRSDFNKYLSYKHLPIFIAFPGQGQQPGGYINDLESSTVVSGYCFYPKDALTK